MFVYMTVTRYTFQNGSISGYLMGDGTGVGKGGNNCWIDNGKLAKL
jgi:hypothetical protein